MRQCAVSGCGKTNVTVFCAPYLDTEMRKMWIKQIGYKSEDNKDLIYVCENHFEARHVTDYGRKRLSPTAIPTLNLPQRSDAEQWDKEVRIFEKNINTNRLVKNPEKLTKIFELCQNRISKILNRQSIFKELSYRTYLNSPYIYRSLIPAFSLLPIEEMRRDLCIKFQSIETDKFYHDLYKYKTNCMTDEQKECYITIEEMDVEPHYYFHIKRDCILGFHNIGGFVRPHLATTAIILTLHGISGKWKQCACIGFVSGNYNVWVWIKRVTKVMLERFQFNVKAIVYRADSKYPNKELDPTKPYLELTHKIYYICEASSLLKLLYYNLMTETLCFDETFPSKQHLLDYINIQKNTSAQSGPKLNYDDLHPTSPMKVNMRQAKKVFSYNMAATLSMYAGRGDLDKSVDTTVAYILTVINLINILNPKVLDGKIIPGHQFQTATTHISYLQIILQMFSNTVYINEATKQGVIWPRDHIKVTINAILLWEKEINKPRRSFIPFCNHKYDYDNFQTILNKVLSEKKHIRPVAKTIDLVFRQVMTRDFLKPYPNKETPDLKNTLMNIHNVVTNNTMESYEKNEENKIYRSDYNHIKLDGVDPLKDLCNFLLEKAYYFHENCEELQRYVNEWRTNDTYNINTKNFFDFVSEMECLFRKTVEKAELYIQDGELSKTLFKILQTIELHGFCECFPRVFVVKLYVRFRIYYFLKKCNKSLKSLTTGSLVFDL